ncbi:MAG: NAD(+)/NADH kinase [Peptococcia bacterium]
MIKSVGLIINYRRKQPVGLGQELIKWFAKRNIFTYALEEDGQMLGLDKEYIVSDLGQQVDCVIVLGGDGTFLRAARLMAPSGVPILGIHLGTLGFLTEVEISEIEGALERLCMGEYYLENRMMLEAQIMRNGKVITSHIGLNDVVINKGSFARINTLEVYADQEFVSTYKADGLVVASPTGSTAYSLSAGGPIVYPELDVIIITPICAHTLHARPIVIPSNKTVQVNIVLQQSSSTLTIDGQHCSELKKGDQVIVVKAPFYARLIRLHSQNFFTVLREKLRDDDQCRYD